MSYGIETYFSNGATQLTITDRLTRFIGAYTVYLPRGGSVWVSVPGMTTDGTWGAVRDSGTYGIGAQIQNGGFTATSYDYSGSNHTFYVFRW